MDDPDVAFAVGGNAADLSDGPVVRQRLWPGGIDREGRDVAGTSGARQRGQAEQDGGSEGDGNGSGKTGNRTVSVIAMWHRHPPLLSVRVFPLGRQSIARR